MKRQLSITTTASRCGNHRHVLPGWPCRLCMAIVIERGVQAPVGLWVPLGFAAGGNGASFMPRSMDELKHSRVGMLPTIGGSKVADIPGGLAAISKILPGDGHRTSLTAASLS